MSREDDPEVVVVGGGPAGLFAAEVLAQAGRRVALHERMPSVGRKFLLAGRGGLNLTHGEPLEGFLERYAPAEPRLRDAVAAFPPDALRGWAAGLGQKTFVGSSGRVFPESLKASPLLRAWLGRLATLGVAITTRSRLAGFAEGGALRFEGPGGDELLRPRAVVLALGGASWPRLGSDGAWAGWLAATGVPTVPFEAANAGVAVPWSEPFRSRFAGVPLKRIGLHLGERYVRGELVVTEHGLEGGAVYALSRPLREALAEPAQVVCHLDLRPDLPHAALAARLGRRRSGDSASTWLRRAGGLDPAAAGLVREAGPVPADPGDAAARVKRAPVRIAGLRPIERAISTAGGVAFAGLDERFMLRARPGTFVAGEMLDGEAPTGGYLLQAAFATGHAAAQGALAWLGTRSPPPCGAEAGVGTRADG